VKTEVPDPDTSDGGTQPTCVRKLLKEPGKLEGSGENVAESVITELGLSIPVGGKIDGGGGPEKIGVVFIRLAVAIVAPGGRNPPQVWIRSSSFES
jgi:hypothetical protein